MEVVEFRTNWGRKWRIRIVAARGGPVAVSRLYPSKRAATRAARRMFPDLKLL